jgi:hypothetical protein
MEQLNYNLMYRWFVGLSPDDPVWDPTIFTKNRDRLQNGEVFAKFMTKLLNHPCRPDSTNAFLTGTADTSRTSKLPIRSEAYLTGPLPNLS